MVVFLITSLRVCPLVRMFLGVALGEGYGDRRDDRAPVQARAVYDFPLRRGPPRYLVDVDHVGVA